MPGDEEDEKPEGDAVPPPEGEGVAAEPAPARRPRTEDEEAQAAGFGEGEYVRARLPDRKKAEMFGIADVLLGGSRLKVNCEDGKSRMCRIPGKMKRRMWIREGDLCILRPWAFQDDKADIVWRYTRTQAVYLSRKGHVPKAIDVF